MNEPKFAIRRLVKTSDPFCFTGQFTEQNTEGKIKPIWSSDDKFIKYFETRESAYTAFKFFGFKENECEVIEFSHGLWGRI